MIRGSRGDFREQRIGLTDIAKRVAGVDRVLAPTDFGRTELRRKIVKYQPEFLAFTSKRAAQEFLGRQVPYGLVDEKEGNTQLFVLPSPSGAARRYWDIRVWQDLAKRLELK